MKKNEPHYITVAGKQLPLIIKKHPRARKLILRHDARQGCVRVTQPRYTSVKAALEFALSKTEWIETQMQKTQHRHFENGIDIPLFGTQARILHCGGRGLVRLEDNQLHITGDPAFLARRTKDFIKKKCLEIIVTKAEHYARTIGVSFHHISLRESKSRWGSCSAKGSLSFCWRLAFAPIEVLDYVVCHEVAHLRHHNHSPSYWKLVATLCPEYQTHERWLKLHGQSVWEWG